jgi:hypothetical protein
MEISDFEWKYFQEVLDYEDFDTIETFFISLTVELRGVIKLYERWLGRLDQPVIVLNSRQSELLDAVEAKAKDYIGLLSEVQQDLF